MASAPTPPEGARGSLLHTWWYVNVRPDLLTDAVFTALPTLAAEATSDLEWVSPLGDEGEAWNEAFLDKLGLVCLGERFPAFWPYAGTGTPHWDALARVRTAKGDGVVMVETKAHLGELDKPRDATGAKDPESLAMIRAAFAEARAHYGVAEATPPWDTSYYQVANRVTHLWWMREKARVPTWLVWLLITNDHASWPRDAAGAPQWRDTFNTVLRSVGLPEHHVLADRIAAAYLPPSPREADG